MFSRDARKAPVFTTDARHISDTKAMLQSQGITPDAVTLGAATESFAHAQFVLSRAMMRRAGRDYRPDENLSRFPDAAPAAPVVAHLAAPVPLLELFGAWSRMTVVKASTVSDTSYAIKALIAFLGHDDAARLTRDDMLRWRAA